MFDMPSNEYIIIEDEAGVYNCTDKLGGICDSAVQSTSQIASLIQEKHELFTQAKILSDSLVNELQMLKKFMDKGDNIPKKTVRKTRTIRKVKKKVVRKTVKRKKPVARRSVAKRKTAKKSMRGLQANLKKINRALK